MKQTISFQVVDGDGTLLGYYETRHEAETAIEAALAGDFHGHTFYMYAGTSFTNG